MYNKLTSFKDYRFKTSTLKYCINAIIHMRDISVTIMNLGLRH
jgi:hypothetical protein